MIHLPAKPGPNQQETPFGPCLSPSERKLQSSSAEKHWSSRARAPPEAGAGGGWRKHSGCARAACLKSKGLCNTLSRQGLDKG